MPEQPAPFTPSSLLSFSQLKGEAVALVDALAPPDFILNSAIGLSNGRVSQFP